MKKLLTAFFLSTVAFGQQIDNTTLQAKYARYDGEEIFLEGEVVIQNSLGVVRAEKAHLKKDETGLCAIDFPFLEISKNVQAQMKSHGLLKCSQVVSDYRLMRSYFTGEPEVYYEDSMGQISATRAVAEYENSDEKIILSKLTLYGDVVLRGKESCAEQYALADLVEYLPKERLLVLKALEGKKVLFFDKGKGMQLSAQKIEGRRQEGLQESVQGFGDVSFVFQEEELQKLKNRFEWK